MKVMIGHRLRSARLWICSSARKDPEKMEAGSASCPSCRIALFLPALLECFQCGSSKRRHSRGGKHTTNDNVANTDEKHLSRQRDDGARRFGTALPCTQIRAEMSDCIVWGRTETVVRVHDAAHMHVFQIPCQISICCGPSTSE